MNPALRWDQRGLFEILVAPHVTEKTTVASTRRQYVFRVAPTATKQDIRRAVEAIFGVQVQAVNVVCMQGKVKQFRQRTGQRADWKKAYVTLRPGQQIELS